VFAVCGVPRERTLRTAATLGERASPVQEVRLAQEEEGVTIELRLSPPVTVTPTAPFTGPDADWLTTKGFGLRGERG